MLRRKNRLMRVGRIEEASAYARRVGVLIERANKGHLQSIDPKSATYDLWKRVGEITKSRSERKPCVNISAEEFNQHYFKISTDLKYMYVSPLVKTTASTNIVSEQQIFFLLDRLRPTATGQDMLPAWFLRRAAPIYSNILAHLIDQSIYQTTAFGKWKTSQWETSIIFPIPKIHNLKTHVDFRPISITPVLSRLLEKNHCQTV